MASCSRRDPMAEEKVSCVEPAGGPKKGEAGQGAMPAPQRAEEVKMEMARVGKKAPDFTAQAYFAGGFKKVSLSDFSGKWMMVCFYPGDFTFV
jgi:peroxiredoxin (alkyl hydroperoxide reductase subunit C)